MTGQGLSGRDEAERDGAARSRFARGALGQRGPARGEFGQGVPEQGRFGQRGSAQGEFGRHGGRRAEPRRGQPGQSRGRRAARGVAAAALALGALAAAGIAAPQEAAAGPRLGDSGPRLGDCPAGDLCLWPDARFRGDRHRYAPEKRTFGSCRRLPGHAGAESFANRTGRPVTVYESAECAETEAFHTHPSGTWTPEGAYRVRAFKVWER